MGYGEEYLLIYVNVPLPAHVNEHSHDLNCDPTMIVEKAMTVLV